MNAFAVDRILARPGHGLDPGQQAVLRRMADYLDRNSLRIVWDDGAAGAALELHVSNDAERIALSMAELTSLWEGMRVGRPVDWASLRRVRE
jgi:hypothetical protein